jgi:uncharacterized membrane protein YhaH (DUF805 family)
MFKNPFSFEGRIRRMEYGLTLIIYTVLYLITLALIGAGGSIGLVIGLVIIIPQIWFLWAQSAKRCHDINRSGWMQLIPFYFLFLLFQNGDLGRNSYGSDPKNPELGIENSNTLDGHLMN